MADNLSKGFAGASAFEHFNQFDVVDDGERKFITCFIEENLSYSSAKVQHCAIAVANSLKAQGDLYQHVANAYISPLLTLPPTLYEQRSLNELLEYKDYLSTCQMKIENINIAKKVLSICIRNGNDMMTVDALKLLSDTYFSNFQSDDGVRFLIESWKLQSHLLNRSSSGGIRKMHLYGKLDEIFFRIQDNKFSVETKQYLRLFFESLLTSNPLNHSLFLQPTNSSQRMLLKIRFFKIYLRILIGDRSAKNVGELKTIRNAAVSLLYNGDDVTLMNRILKKPEIRKSRKTLEITYQTILTKNMPVFQERKTWDPSHPENWVLKEKNWTKYLDDSRKVVVKYVDILGNVVKLQDELVTCFVQERLYCLYHEAVKVLEPNDPLLFDIVQAYYGAAYYNRHGGPKRVDGCLMTDIWNRTCLELGQQNSLSVRLYIWNMYVTFRTANGKTRQWCLSPDDLTAAEYAVQLAKESFGPNHELTAMALQILGCAQSKYRKKTGEAHYNLGAAVETLRRLMGGGLQKKYVPEDVCNILKRVVHAYVHGKFNKMEELRDGLKYAKLYLRIVEFQGGSISKRVAAENLVVAMEAKVQRKVKNTATDVRLEKVKGIESLL